MGLATLISVAGCAVTDSTSIPKIAFEVQTAAGTILEVRVRSYGIGLPDAELQRLMKKAMDSAIGRAAEFNPVQLAPGEVAGSMIWHVTGRPGRPATTFVGVELFAGDNKTSAAYALICGPDDPLVRAQLMMTVSNLTSRLLKNRQWTHSIAEPNPNAIQSER